MKRLNINTFFFTRISVIVLIIASICPLYGQSTTFAIIGDFGSNNTHEGAVANMVASWSPSYIITVGDNTYNGNYSNDVGLYYSQFITNNLSTNHFWPAAGNHDWSYGSNLSTYLNYFTLPNNGPGSGRYYTILIGDIEFFMIDSDNHEPDGTSSSSNQANWIKNQIQSSNATWKLVIFHHPAYCSGGSTSYMRWPYKSWGADAAFSGHIHVYERLIENNFLYFVDGLGGASIANFNNIISGSQFHYNSNYGAMKVIENSGSLQFLFYSIGSSQPIDSYVITSSNPVQLTLFDAHFDGTNVNLNWNTATEVNNYGFEIERSFDNSKWNKIGFVFGNGNSNVPHNYSFIDNDLNLSGTYRYRLKQVDNDGKFEYSKIVEVKVTSPGQYVLLQNYPNPFNPSTTIEYSLPVSGMVSLTIYDELGRLVKTLVNDFQNGGSYKVKFNGDNLSSGIYFYRLTVSQSNSINFNQTKSFILEK